MCQRDPQERVILFRRRRARPPTEEMTTFVEHVEFETLDWVDWFNTRRLLEPIGRMPPAEFEELPYRPKETPTLGVGLR